MQVYFYIYFLESIIDLILEFTNRVNKYKHDNNSYEFNEYYKDPKTVVDFIKSKNIKLGLLEKAYANNELLKDEVSFYNFVQFIFYKQFNELVTYAKQLGIELICDLPIYVSMDSSDVWSNIDLFMFDSQYNPTLVAGVPPDYFSATGQLWGNPLYNYRKMKKDNYAWWVNRIKHIGKYCKNIRIDHFRGFESFYAIKYGESTAINGKWIKGPGIELFNQIKNECPDVNIIAEDLGIITRKVNNLIKECEFPGMKVLQFAFDGSKNNAYLPKKHIPNSVCYIGTHDNQTLKGFVDSLSEDRKDYIKKLTNDNVIKLTHNPKAIFLFIFFLLFLCFAHLNKLIFIRWEKPI